MSKVNLSWSSMLAIETALNESIRTMERITSRTYSDSLKELEAQDRKELEEMRLALAEIREYM